MTVVENAADAGSQVDEWRGTPEPSLRIGAVEAEGPYAFARIQKVVGLSNGTILALDGLTREVRFFDSIGRHLQTNGGQGRGPGELARPVDLWALPGDTAAVWDQGQQRFVFFDRDGALLGAISIPLNGDPIGFLEDGRVLTESSSARAAPGDREGVVHNQKVFTVLDRAGLSADTLAILGDMQLYQWSEEGTVGFEPVPFTTDESGVAAGAEVVLTVGMALELRLFSSEGVLFKIVQAGMEARPLDVAAFREEVERRIGLAEPETRPRLRRWYAAMPTPSSMPGYTRVLSDPRGGFWAEQFTAQKSAWPPTSKPSLWTIFDSEGAVTAKARLPRGFTLHGVSSDALLGVHVDDLGVEYVQLFSRPGGPMTPGPR